ncbi:MAG: hypothetical protein FJY67_03550 [Calditrichaeota bacterium]|nr:hypothetical protein [Calditrichota bacterium]
MNRTIGQTLFWAPRILTIAFALFLALFALDATQETSGLWEGIGATLIHLLPTSTILLILVAAWRWEWIGALLYVAAGVAYIVLFPPARQHLSWILTISGPAFLIGILFLFNWFKHNELRRLHGHH